MTGLAQVELTKEETVALLSLAKGRMAEVERMIQGMEEGEGMDLQRHNALKAARRQLETMTDLVLKLEGAAREAA